MFNKEWSQIHSIKSSCQKKFIFWKKIWKFEKLPLRIQLTGQGSRKKNRTLARRVRASRKKVCPCNVRTKRAKGEKKWWNTETGCLFLSYTARQCTYDAPVYLSEEEKKKFHDRQRKIFNEHLSPRLNLWNTGCEEKWKIKLFTPPPHIAYTRI